MRMDAPVSYAQKREWYSKFPVDRDGTPTSRNAYTLLRYFFAHRNKSFLPADVGNAVFVDAELVAIMCRQLELIFLLVQSPASSGKFQYFLRSPNTDFQAKVERALIEHQQPGVDH
jgi:hypothetical protein